MDLYYYRGATCAVKARLVAFEKGNLVNQIEIQRSDLLTPEYRKLNPRGTVPTLVDGSFVLPESTTIMRYIDEVGSSPSLQPSNAAERAKMNNWLKAFDEEVFPALGYLTLSFVGGGLYEHLDDDELMEHWSRTSPNTAIARLRFDAVRRGDASDAALEGFRASSNSLAAISKALEDRPWLSGGDYGLADAAFTPGMERWDEMGLGSLWSDDPRISDWWARLRSRASYDAIIATAPNPLADEMREKGRRAVPGLQARLGT